MRGALIILASSLAWTGCVGSGAYAIERTVGGAQRLGAFVSPHSYENFVLGELARERGALAEAAEHYEQARAGAEDDPLLIARLADARDRLGDHAAADRALAEGDRLDPSSQAIAMTRGEIAERRGDPDAAIAAYARAAELAEGDEAPFLALARVLRDRGASERADAILEQAITQLPGRVGAARARLALSLARGDARAAGLAALELARTSPAPAAEVAESAQTVLDSGHPILAHRILELLPAASVPRMLRLRVAIAAGERDEAEALLASWTLGDARELVAAADAWLALGDAAQSAELAELALARGAGTSAQLALARARIEEGRITEAATLASQISPGSSGETAARAVIVDALERSGMPALGAEVRAAPPR